MYYRNVIYKISGPSERVQKERGRLDIQKPQKWKLGPILLHMLYKKLMKKWDRDASPLPSPLFPVPPDQQP